MNNDFSKTNDTIFLADVRSLKDSSLFSFYLSKVSSERRRDIDTKQVEEDRLLSLGGGVLLDCLLEAWNVEDQVLHTAEGKPFACHHPEIHLSLTHAYPYAAAMISLFPCGLDIEQRDRDLEAVVRRYYTLPEKEFCQNDPCKITDIWCRKECWIKCYHPLDVRYIDTYSIPKDYEFVSLPLINYSFEVLKKKGDFHFQKFFFHL